MEEEREREKGVLLDMDMCTHIHGLICLAVATSRNMLKVKNASAEGPHSLPLPDNCLLAV